MLTAISETAKRILNEQGRTQKWVAEKMNQINPSLEMDRNKLSGIMSGNRKMTGDELLAFCMALEISPDIFTGQENNIYSAGKEKGRGSKEKPTFNDIRKEHGLGPVEGGDVILTKA